MPEADMKWVANAILDSSGKLDKERLQLWLHPPPIRRSSGKPMPEKYFLHKVLVWMPRNILRIPLACSREGCGGHLRSKGIYNRVRSVMDLDSIYFMVTEYMECSNVDKKGLARCNFTTQGWHENVLCQLSEAHRLMFPAVATAHGTLDRKVLTMLKIRTLGNSSNALHHSLMELHTETWMRQCIHYLTDCLQHKNGISGHLEGSPEYAAVPPPTKLKGARWLVDCHSKDLSKRVDEVKAQITSVFGRILKLDSTKKVNVT